MIVRFAGFELDQARSELRTPDGEVLKLRPKTLTMLELFAANAGRVLSKQDLMDAVWPDVHVAEDSLFKCIREIRAALGDDKRQLIKLLSGRGYIFEADVVHATADPDIQSEIESPKVNPAPVAPPPPTPRFGRRTVVALAVAAGVVAAGLAVAAITPDFLGRRGPVTVAVMPITAEGDLVAIAADVTTRLSDGLAKIDNVRVVAPQAAARDTSAARSDFVVSGALGKREGSWEVQARMIRTTTGDIVWNSPVSVASDERDLKLQQSRLAASIGQPLAQRINALINSDANPNDSPIPSGTAGVAINQALASITQTTPERFAASQTILEKAIADNPGNVDLAVALAGLQMRGVQMVWFTPDESAAVAARARAVLERGLKRKPAYLPVLEAYCRFLNATNEFVDSLVACGRVLSFDPWNGVALFNIGLGQMQLGRFDEALATFKEADRFDTPPASRWTWKLGAGLTYLLMGNCEDAVLWLQRSIAITPATGRSHMLLSAAYQRLGRPDEARAAMEKAMTLRPGSNLGNTPLPRKNESSAYLAAVAWIERAFVAAGLPER